MFSVHAGVQFLLYYYERSVLEVLSGGERRIHFEILRAANDVHWRPQPGDCMGCKERYQTMEGLGYHIGMALLLRTRSGYPSLPRSKFWGRAGDVIDHRFLRFISVSHDVPIMYAWPITFNSACLGVYEHLLLPHRR